MKYLISAGPTRERIDPVRFISNRSSGKMGYALAKAAISSGHKVTLVSGPVFLSPPEGVEVINVESAEDMAHAVKEHFSEADVTIMAAAVADYSPVNVSVDKIKKSGGKLILEMKRTEDILSTIGKLKTEKQILVGFAAESSDLIENAKDKLRGKNLDWIVANDISKTDRGFGVDQNEVIMISANGEKLELPLADKKELAEKIIAKIGQ